MAAMVKVRPGFTVPEPSLYQRDNLEYICPLTIVMMYPVRYTRKDTTKKGILVDKSFHPLGI